VKSLFSKTIAAVIVIAALAGCAGTGVQEIWFDYLDRVNAVNGAD
jgi:hypothetical protein